MLHHCSPEDALVIAARLVESRISFVLSVHPRGASISCSDGVALDDAARGNSIHPSRPFTPEEQAAVDKAMREGETVKGE